MIYKFKPRFICLLETRETDTLKMSTTGPTLHHSHAAKEWKKARIHSDTWMAPHVNTSRNLVSFSRSGLFCGKLLSYCLVKINLSHRKLIKCMQLFHQFTISFVFDKLQVFLSIKWSYQDRLELQIATLLLMI